jgi:hypothetical protein
MPDQSGFVEHIGNALSVLSLCLAYWQIRGIEIFDKNLNHQKVQRIMKVME